MTALDALNNAAALSRPEPKRDRWGRYVIPHPDTGKPHTWTRATTWAKTCADTFGLTKWELRMATLGLARRPDLLAQAATVTDPDDPDAKRLLGKVVDQAKEAAGSLVRANLGTALHSFTEQIDAGTEPTIPDSYRADLDAYQAETADLAVDPAHIERIVTVPEFSVAGTFDRLVTHNGTLRVLDIKTGRDLSYSWGEIAIQLALYAHAATIWDQATGTHTPMPTVDDEIALVAHMPVGEGQCRLYRVNIAAGWEMATTCGTVRDWRKRKDLAEPVTSAKRRAEHQTVEKLKDGFPGAQVVNPKTLRPVADNTPDEPADRQAWIRQRITAAGGNPDARAWLARLWPAEIPTPKTVGPDGWTDDQIDALAEVLTSVEGHVKAPFHTGDPARATGQTPATPEPTAPVQKAPPVRDLDDGITVVDPLEVDALRTQVKSLPDPQRHQMVRWSKDAATQGRPWSSKLLTERTLAISRAAVACVTHLWDDGEPDALTRAALAEALDRDLATTWWTGAVLGSLTIAEAERLAPLAAAFTDDDDTAVAAIGARLATTA